MILFAQQHRRSQIHEYQKSVNTHPNQQIRNGAFYICYYSGEYDGIKKDEIVCQTTNDHHERRPGKHKVKHKQQQCKKIDIEENRPIRIVLHNTMAKRIYREAAYQINVIRCRCLLCKRFVGDVHRIWAMVDDS